MRLICKLVELEIIKSFELLATSFQLMVRENRLAACSLQLVALDLEHHIIHQEVSESLTTI